MNDPVKWGARVGGEVALEFDLPVHNTDLSAGLDGTACERGREVSQRKRFSADKDFVGQAMIAASEIGGIQSRRFERRRGNECRAP